MWQWLPNNNTVSRIENWEYVLKLDVAKWNSTINNGTVSCLHLPLSRNISTFMIIDRSQRGRWCFTCHGAWPIRNLHTINKKIRAKFWDNTKHKFIVRCVHICILFCFECIAIQWIHKRKKWKLMMIFFSISRTQYRTLFHLARLNFEKKAHKSIVERLRCHDNHFFYVKRQR